MDATIRHNILNQDFFDQQLRSLVAMSQDFFMLFPSSIYYFFKFEFK